MVPVDRESEAARIATIGEAVLTPREPATAVFRVEFDRIGRHHNPAPVIVELPWDTEDFELLADRIESAACGHLASQDRSVVIEIDQPSGRVRCRILAGVRNDGIGTITRLDVPDWRPGVLAEFDRQEAERAAMEGFTEQIRERARLAAGDDQIATLELCVTGVLDLEPLAGPDQSFAAGYWAALRTARATIACQLNMQGDAVQLLLGGGEVATS